VKQFRHGCGCGAALESREPAGEPDFDLVGARSCDSAIALRASQFSDGVGSQFGGTLRLLLPVLEVNRKLFRSFDGSL